MAYNPPPAYNQQAYGQQPYGSGGGGGGGYGYDPENVSAGNPGYIASDPYARDEYNRVNSTAGNDPTAAQKNVAFAAYGNPYGNNNQNNQQPQMGDYSFEKKPTPQPMIVDDGGRFNYGESHYRDLIFAILFLIHFVLFLVCTIYYGSRMSYNTNTQTGTTAFDAGKTISILVVSAIIGAAWAAVFLEIMKRYANKIIYFMLVVNAILCFVGMILAFWQHAYGAGVIYLLNFVFACLLFWCWRHRIPFAHAVLHASATTLQRYSGPIYTAYGLAVVSLGWFALWAFTVSSLYYQGSSNNDSNGLTTGQKFILIYLLFSFYWTAQVLKNVGHTTTAGVVATFYFQPQTSSPTLPALKRTLTTSFGSICLGSLIVALLEMARYGLRVLQQNARNDNNFALACLACMAECILAQIEAWVRYLNSYAYCHVAIYGTKFMDAAKATMDLFQARLFDAVINDDLIGLVLFFGSMTAGAIACIVAIIWGAALNFDMWSTIAVLAFIVGFAVSMLFFTVVASAVKTTFVCWALDPLVIQQNHPELYQNLMNAQHAAGYNVQINTNARAGNGQV